MDTKGTGALKSEGKFTLEDWKTWPEGERWELIEGEAYSMSPAPRLVHQRVLGELFLQIGTLLKGKPCEPFISPVDVFLSESQDTVVQPDLLIVCDPNKCKEDGIWGAPDWILEILSPATSYRDQTEKRNLYEKHGVREYWILNPDTLDLIVYQLNDGSYGPPQGYRLDSVVEIGIFSGLNLVL